MQLHVLFAVNVEPVVAGQGDLVEDRHVHTRVAGHGALNVAAAENLALGLHVCVETGLVFGTAIEFGLRDVVGIVDGVIVGCAVAQYLLNFTVRLKHAAHEITCSLQRMTVVLHQRSFKQIPDIFLVGA